MKTAPGTSPESFLLSTFDGFSLRRRAAEPGAEWVLTNLGEKPCVLIAFLALVRTPVPRQLLCDLLWQGAQSGRSRNSLRQALFRARRILGARSIHETADGVFLARGVVEVDLERALADAVANGSLDSLGPSLAPRFGHTTRPIGKVFEHWRGRVRRQLSEGKSMAFQIPELTDSRGAAFAAVGADLPARSRLEQLYRLSSHGIPITVWVAGRPESELRRTVESFAADCRGHGACVASVTRRAGVEYSPSALERDIAEAVWPLPGAAGIRPDHLTALERLAKGHAVEPSLLREATLDLIAAVAENAPLVITLGDPGRYSFGALTTLVTDLAARRDRAVLLVVADHAGVCPAHPLCIEVPLLGSVVRDRGRLPKRAPEDRPLA